MTDLQELKRLALAATPGPWYHCQPFKTVPNTRTIHGKVAGQRVDFVSTRERPVHQKIVVPMEGDEPTVSSCDMAFIAAANPVVILDLIAQLEQAKADAARYQVVRSPHGPDLSNLYYEDWDAEVDAYIDAAIQSQPAKKGDV